MFAILVRPGGKVIAIAGNLLTTAIPELQSELDRAPGLTLDCSELRRVDPASAAFLRRWRCAGGTLVGLSQLLTLLLEAESESQVSEPDDRSETR